MDKAVALLAARSRTEKEIADALYRNAYPEETIARVMQRLLEAGYLNDTHFSERWAASRSLKGMGARRIKMELRSKGIDTQKIDLTLSALDESDIFEGAVNAARKAARGKDVNIPGDRQKILASLARRGYDYSMARRALEAIIEEMD